MKRILLTMVMFASISFAALAQVTSITVETVYTDNGTVTGYPTGHSTYRIYANCTNPTDRVSTVYGDANSPLVLNVGGSGIWNHPFGGVYGTSANCVLIGAQPIVGYDSYYTFGYTCGSVGTNPIYTFEDDNQFWSDEAFNTVPYGQGNTFINSTIGGAWTGLSDNVNTEAGANLKVLLAQITTNGDICGVFNLQVTPNFVNTNSPTLNQVGLSFGTGDCGTPGCTDPLAVNYDAEAGFNDGLCLYDCALAITDVMVTNPTCAGDTDGEVEVMVTGNQGTASYSFNGGAFANGDATFSNLGNGTVSIVVKDLRFDNEQVNPGGVYGTCEVTEEVSVETLPLLISGGLGEGVTCAGDGDGCVSFANYSGGTGNVEYALYQGNNAVIGADNQAIVLDAPSYCGLDGGIYNFEVTDANGCTASSANVTVTSPATFALVEGFEAAASCYNSEDGIQVINWGGGSGDIMFSFEDDGTYDIMGNVSNVVLENLMAGDYTLYAIDGNGCTDELMFSLAGGPAIEVTVMVTSPSCPGAGDGSIGLMASGGTGDLTFSFDGANYSDISVLDGLASDLYMGYVQDENVCTAELEIIVEDPTPIEASAVGTNITCAGLSNGSILVSATGGTDILFYSVNGGEFTPSPLFEDLSAGEYDVVVEDVNGCSFVLNNTILISEPAAIEASASAADITCNGFGNGALSISAAGGTGSFLYSVGGAFSSVNPITGLEPNTYTVVVQDANGCTVDITGLVVTEPSAVTITGLDANSIDEDAGGNTVYTVAGGTPTYQYEWVDANGTVVSTTQNLPGLTDAADAGEYTLTITDENGCETSETITISGISSLNNSYSIAVYPNPSVGTFRLALNGLNGEKVTYTILDESGRTVAAKDLSSVAGERVENIDLTNIASGIYIMNVNIAGSVESMRLIIQ